MIIVKFVRPYLSIPLGFSFEYDGIHSVRLNEMLFSKDNISDLQDMGIVSVVDTSPSVATQTPVVPDLAVRVDFTSDACDKTTKAVTEDLDNHKFVFGNDYKFYDVENKVWKVSRLKKTASHIGRLVGGFAVPVDASAKKMFNRLEKLNEMYYLGLDRETCRDITNYYN